MDLSAIQLIIKSGFRYLPLNPQVGILKSEPYIWIIIYVISLIYGGSFFEFPIKNNFEKDDNIYVSIKEFMELFEDDNDGIFSEK